MARTKNRFNAVQIPEPVTAGVPVKQRKSFRVALYARLSVELKSRPSESIANQLSILREFIRNKAEFAEYHEYVDSAVSGTSFDRPAFGQMMNDVREGKISCIIVKDMSRFGRDYIEASNYIETIFPFLGVRFISVSDHFDTEAEFNQNKALEIALKNLVNDMYAKDISKRVSVSRRLDMERGKFTGSNAPYGYKVDSGDALRKYVIDRDAAAVVRQIFELAADGVTLREIAKALQEYRLALPGDYLKTGNLYVENGAEAKAWYPGTISNILKNQAYIGNMVQGKRRTSLYDNEARHATDENDWIVVENTHEAIVDKELFNKVRAVMDKKVEESIFTSGRGKNLPIKEDIFAGILFCGNCGRRIPLASRILEKDGVLERQYFYSCRYNYDFGWKQCGCTIMEQELIKVVNNLLTTQIAVMTDSARTEASKDLSKKVETGKHSIWAQGGFSEGTPPYGYYRATDGSRKLLIDEEVSDNVVRIFNMFLDGKGYAGIAKTLQNEGILSPPKYRFYKAGKIELAEKAREWHYSHVKEILQGEYYIGNIVHGKQRKALDTGRKNVKTDASTWQRIENVHEPIIDKDTFYKTRERMEHIKKKHLEASKPKADVPNKPDNILVYKTKCACCGGSVLIGRHHTYSEKFYYKCKNRRKLARLCENKYSYDYSEVMDSVFSVIRQHMSLCVEKTKFVQKMNSRKENVLQYDIYTKQIAKLQNDVRRITANKSGLYEDYREQLITAEELCQYQREYESRVNEIEAQITELLHRRSLYEKEFHIDEGWEETVNKYMTKRKLTKELVDAFVSEIVFYDGNIEVKLLYDDFLKELLKVAEEREVSSNG